MSDSINMVILAAGQGTRLKLDIAKPLCPLNGKKLVDYAIKGIFEFSTNLALKSSLDFVVGHKKEDVQGYLESTYQDKQLSFVVQDQQLGTGHALKCYFDSCPTAWDNEYTLVSCADTPLINAYVFEKLLNHLKTENLSAVCASFITDNPRGYGRIVTGEGQGFKIVEEKDATDSEKKITEVNSGVYIFKTKHIREYINNLSNNNNSSEFYLTDLFQLDYAVETICFEDGTQFCGVNNLVQLELTSKELCLRKIRSLQLSGVIFINSDAVYIDDEVEVQSRSVIYPNVTLKGETRVGHGVTIESGSTIVDSHLEEEVLVKSNSYIESSTIGKASVIGPMAHLRPGSILGYQCKIGNFVETKKVKLSDGVKVSHLSYVGDADIGERTNIGCGFITCNYDGANKHKTVIGSDSFIGSDCQMIAPVNLGSRVFIGSGSTINKDVPDDAFAIARQRQITKEGAAKKFLKNKK